MRKLLAACVALACFFPAGSASAGEDLFRKFNCMACHHASQKRVGPSLQQMAIKYRGDDAAAGLLARRIRTGGAGVWGQMPMPPQPQVSEADASTLAHYILSIDRTQ